MQELVAIPSTSSDSVLPNPTFQSSKKKAATGKTAQRNATSAQQGINNAQAKPKPKNSAAPKRKKPQTKQHTQTTGQIVASSAPDRELRHMKRAVKSLVFKNAALYDEVARLNMRVHVVAEERKVLLKRLVDFERQKMKKSKPTKKQLNQSAIVATSEPSLQLSQKSMQN